MASRYRFRAAPPVEIDGPTSLTTTTMWWDGWGDCELKPCRLQVKLSFPSRATAAFACGLFRKGVGGWRRQTPSEDGTWTLVQAKGEVVELGVGVVIPEAKAAPAQMVWPRAFTVEVSTKSKNTTRLRSPVPRGALCHTLGTRAGRGADDRLANCHGRFGRLSASVCGKNAAQARCSPGRRNVRPVDARHD